MMRFLLFGYGSIGRKHAEILRSMGHEVVSVDPNPKTGAELCWSREVGLTEYVTGKSIVFTEFANAIVGILDCTPPDVRFGSLFAMDVPVFVEKPLGRIVAASPHKKFQVGFCYYFLPSLREYVESLVPYRLYSITMVAGQDLHTWHPGHDYRERYHGTPGRGGVVNDSLPHSLFIARWILGELDLVGSVTGRLSGLDIRTEDTATVLSEAHDTGVPCTILVDYLREPRGSYIEAVTSGGVMRWEFDPEEAHVMYASQMDTFCEVCAGRRQYGFPTLADGLAVQKILDEVAA